MFWSKSPPTYFPDYRCKDTVTNIKREELNAKSLGIVGPKKSGKSTFLAKNIIHKSDKENALVLCTYATERKFWTNIIETHNITKTVIHTPDSLARYLLSLWAKKEGKKFEWILDKDTNSKVASKLAQNWRDEKSYASWLLSSNKMTAGIAHWLLSNEIENFIENKMLPDLDILCVDQPEEWEPEAQSWVKLLPRTRTIITSQSTHHVWENGCEQTKFLYGSYDYQGQLSNYRSIKAITMLPLELKDSSCVICQTPLRIKTLKEIYRKTKGEVKRAEQIKGLTFKELYIESLPSNTNSILNWGNRSQSLDYLDLIASKGKTYGVITEEDEKSYLPKRNPNERFLIWKPYTQDFIENK